MGVRLGFYALIFIVGFVTAGLGLISQGSQGQVPGQASAIAATLASNNGNGDDDDDDDNDNDEDNQNEGDSGDPFAAQAASSGGGASASGGSGGSCAPAGSDTVIGSADGRIAVHVFKTMPRSVRITIVTPVDPATVPAVQGKVDALIFQILADDCGDHIIGAISPGPGVLPAEVNLGVHYSDQDVGSLNESKFALAWLDPETNTWKPLPKQAPDPGANYVSGTIFNTGIFVVHQTP
jgi:hypothetical protein